ncbi:hypothetical protein ABMY23_23445 [Vibrio vulnificus]|uniref:hypothetical protein n=1 Tax=Vibrio vulnificus TaxID=672 RepID=UPI004059DEB8
MFKPSEESQKLKTQVLTLSVVCLFIAMSGALPKRVALIGLDLSVNPEVSGWFLLVVTAYIFLKFLVTLGLEVVKSKLPSIIESKTSKTTGDTIGLTQKEIYEHHQRNEVEEETVGTVSGEAKEIELKNNKITAFYINTYKFVHNSWVYLTDYFLPVALCLYAMCSLRGFLLTEEALKLT